MTQTKSKREIIDETAAFYVADPTQRGIDNDGPGAGGCVYYTNHDVHGHVCCAVGRCLIEPEAWKGSILSVEVAWPESGMLDQHLKPEYRGHSMMFWEKLQEFHDDESHWDEYGLTYTGRYELDELRSDFDD